MLPAQRFDRRATSATELALLLPMLVVLLLGGVDMGRAAHAYLALSNVSRTAAEYGAMRNVTDHTRPFWEAQLITVGREEMTGTSSLDPGQITFQVSTATDDESLNEVTVEATYPFTMLVRWPGLPTSFTLRRATTMRQIR